jgi:hypothetical protein
MRLVWQWNNVQEQLPPDWTDARVAITVAERDADRAAGLLGGANPLRQGDTLRLFVSRGGAIGPEALRRALLRLDRAGLGGTLELAGASEAAPQPEAAPARLLAHAWRERLAALPHDWSDMLVEITFRSSDQLERAALLISPVNARRVGSSLALRFRAAHTAGYGVSATMAGRCFERLDEEEIPAELEILRVLCDTDHVGTQGPVWRVAGKAV